MAEIWPDEAAGTWLLEMRSTAYALGLADDGAALRHLHWGSRVPRPAAASLLVAARGGRASQYVAADGAEAAVLAWWGPGQCDPGRPRRLRQHAGPPGSPG